MLAIDKELTVEQRLSKAVVDIMGHPKCAALNGIVMIGDRTVEENVPTACTNGRDEMYGRNFVTGLTDAELRFVVLHETFHKLYRHLVTWRHLWSEDPKLTNMACDYVINIKIVFIHKIFEINRFYINIKLTFILLISPRIFYIITVCFKPLLKTVIL